MNLERHLRMHHSSLSIEIRPLTCETCDSRFRNKEALDKHNLKYHYKIFTCNICQKQLRSFASLKTHLLAHSDQLKVNKLWFSLKIRQNRVFKNIKSGCSLDNLILDSQRDEFIDFVFTFQRHACPNCTESFTNKATLDSHQVKVHGKNPVICDEW